MRTLSLGIDLVNYTKLYIESSRCLEDISASSMKRNLQVTCINPCLLLKVFSEDIGYFDSIIQDATIGHSLR